jgi:hypothetical protein
VARHRFHHLVVEARSALPADPLGRLLSQLPLAPPEAPVDLWLETRAASAGELAPRLEGEPVLVRGDQVARVGGGAVELCGPGSRFTVDALPLPRVIGLVQPEALASPAGLDALAEGAALLAFAVALRARGVFHLHAAGLVLVGERAVLVPALAGAGRSTLAVALVAAGAEFLGDADVFVVRRAGALRLLALPGAFRLAERAARAVRLEAHLEPGPAAADGTRHLDAQAVFPGQFRWEAPAPALILLPRLSGEPRSRLEPAGPAEALGQLLECSTLAAARGLPGGDGHLPLLGALADGARVLHAELGLDLLAEGAAVARRLVADLADA